MRNEYEVRGDVVAIFLKRKGGERLETLIDLADLEKASSLPLTWFAHYVNHDKIYVRGHLYTGTGKPTYIYLHRLITDAPEGSQVDHIVPENTLANRRSVNIRVATKSFNMHNLNGPPKHNTSGYLNVGWEKRKKKWQGVIS